MMDRAEEMARARREFVEAMTAGCSILELRRRHADARARLRQRAHAEVAGRTADLQGKQGFVVIDEAADFGRWDSRWMMRD
ncbi:MAG: hypothetical protein AB7E60_01790 [Sphingobium sp.]